MKPTIVYFADPMCSWCWGFSAVVAQLRSQYEPTLEFEPIMGGLRSPRTGTPDAVVQYLQRVWAKVQEKTGQTFIKEVGLPEGFVYDTRPSCRAVVAAQQLGADGFAALAAVQEAFYTRLDDVTQPQVLASILAPLSGCSIDEFLVAYRSPTAAEETERQIDYAFETGISGFPSMAGFGVGRPQLLTTGYVPLAQAQEIVEHWLGD